MLSSESHVHPLVATPEGPSDDVGTDQAGLDQQPEGNGPSRERSTIRFPYGDLNDAVQVAEAITHEHGLGCSMEQLAAALSQTTTSGAFRTKVATAQTFGAVEVSRAYVSLTPLGRELASPDTEEAARINAFLNVELYGRIYDLFKGRMLPADKGLSSEMIKAGVSPKQADRARQAFHRSADQAGFYRSGRGRLVPPPVTNMAAVKPTVESRPGVIAQEAEGTRGHAMIQGLWQELPTVKEWPADQHDRWFEAARVIFSLVYQDASEVENYRSTVTPPNAS